MDDLQTQTPEGLERTHDYIQWLFPLPERSSANPDAPRLSSADIDDRVLLELQSRDWTKKNVVALRQIAEHAVNRSMPRSTGY